MNLALQFTLLSTFGSAANNFTKRNFHAMIFACWNEPDCGCRGTGQNKVGLHYQGLHSLLESDKFNYFRSPEKFLHIQPEELLVSP